jgi:DNA-binding PadR family transcriptional regulator
MPAVTPRLKDLEREGLVTRSTDPSDARVSLISLSPAGLEVLRRLRAARCAVLAEALGSFGGGFGGRGSRGGGAGVEPAVVAGVHLPWVR